MLRVRRSLTEILLEVTNEEIGTVCREIWTRARSKGTRDKSNRDQTSNNNSLSFKVCLIIKKFSNYISFALKNINYSFIA